MTQLDITGTVTKMLRLPVPQDTRDALKEQDIEAPEFVVLHLRQATLRERERFEQAQRLTGRSDAEMTEWLAGLILRRATEGTDPRVVRELVKDLQPTQMTQIMYAYVSGEAVEDPKAQAALAEVVRTQTMLAARPVLETLASGGQLLFSPTFTGSDPGK